MVGQEDRKRSVAGCQSWEHTEPCLRPGRAPSTGAERGWVKGHNKGGGLAEEEKKACRDIRMSRLCRPIKSVVCVGQKVACQCEVNC